MRFQGLSHLKIPHSSVSQLYNALRIQTTDKNFRVLHKVTNVGNNVFRKDGRIRGRDDCHQYELFGC
jgi:hypothetical protein